MRVSKLAGMPWLTALAGLAMSGLSTTASADYLFEFTGDYAIDVEQTNDLLYAVGEERTPQAWDANARLYFSPIEDGEVIRGEAAFISRTSSAALGYSKNPYANVAEKNGYSGNVELFIGDGVIGATYTSNEYGNTDLEALLLEFGYHVGANTRLSIVRGTDVIASEFQAMGAPNNLDSESLGFNIRWLSGTAGPAVALEAAVNVVDVDMGSAKLSEEELDLGFAADVYVTRDISLSVNVSKANLDEVDFERFGIGAEWFIIPKLAIGVRYSNTDAEIRDIGLVAEEKIYAATLTGRL